MMYQYDLGIMTKLQKKMLEMIKVIWKVIRENILKLRGDTQKTKGFLFYPPHRELTNLPSKLYSIINLKRSHRSQL